MKEQVQSECTHLTIGHCGSSYRCFNCGLTGETIKLVWDASLHRPRS